uniref:Uncharacterized protein n=1 Tax=Rhizophora mucronata TaxID=61149 RepID=A0A2P2R2R1_RHIMU
MLGCSLWFFLVPLKPHLTNYTVQFGG